MCAPSQKSGVKLLTLTGSLRKVVMANSYKKEIREIVRLAESQGCISKKHRKKSHGSLLIPNGEIVVYSATPSDFRAIRRFRSDLRKRGIRV